MDLTDQSETEIIGILSKMPLSSKEIENRLTQMIFNTLEKFIYLVCEKIVQSAKDIIEENKAVATRELKNNIRYNVTRTVGAIFGVVGVGANVPYGIFRHEGTRPHFPPIEPIQKWVIQKGLMKDNQNKPLTMHRLKSPKNQGLEQKSLSIAFAIARAISKRGTIGLPFLKMALNQNLSWIEQQANQIKLA